MKKYLYLFLALLIIGCNKSGQPANHKKFELSVDCSTEESFDKWVKVENSITKQETWEPVCLVSVNRDGTLVKVLFKNPKSNQHGAVMDINDMILKE